MADLATVRTNVKVLLDRNFTTIDTVVDLAINSAIELIGRNIAAVYEEEFWSHTFDSDDTTNKTDNFPLPSNTNYIRTYTLIDTTTAGEETFYPLIMVSPDDAYDTDKIEGYRSSGIGYYVNSRDISATETWNLNTFRRGGVSTIGRSNRSGRPELIYRVAQNVYIQPYISSDYEGWKLRLLLQMYPDSVSADGDENTITVNYPHALMHFAAGIVWSSRLHDQQRAQAEFQLGAQYLSEVATNDELGKLVNIQSRIVV